MPAGPRWLRAAPAACRPPAQHWRPQQQRNGREVAAHALDTATVVQDMAVEDFQQLMESEPAVLVDFYTTWCGPCKVLDLALKALEPGYKGRCAFLKVDAQQNYQLAQHFKVSKLPTMIVFRGGLQVDRIEGVMTAQDLDLKLRSLLEGPAPNPNTN
ncbi:thiol reductase thioredoxin [Chlorella sorokiniana]|uniref:Thiol reductase thioredoxin n=1 Tax=Chlorella sorokiniana TaxID=3076 RepID=A0A2P6TL68_CHLSO|nr:thiol reductase thioredoxin [Chlorella sorokiniana]|eukprot:PRW45031.1 thiol reductase thioredoxin [Chlorella sorokiniana]